MSTVRFCTCAHAETTHPDGECTHLTWSDGEWQRCDCRAFVPAEGEQVVLL